MHKADSDRFRALLDEMADVFSKPRVDDVMLRGYWNALKDLPLEIVERCAATHRRYGKFFPKPFELRPKGDKPKHEDPNAGPPRNYIRDYWRSAIVDSFCRCLGHTAASFEPVLVEHKTTLGVSMRALLDELEQQERRDGRTEGQHRYVMRMAEAFARSSPSFCTKHAPRLPPAPADAEPELAF